MLSVYEPEARRLMKELGQCVLVRDDKPIKRGLEVPQYCVFCRIRPLLYSPLACAGLETLYTREGENVEIATIVRQIIPSRYPKTFRYLLSKYSVDYVMIEYLRLSFVKISESSKLVEEMVQGSRRFKISDDVRKFRFLPKLECGSSMGNRV